MSLYLLAVSYVAMALAGFLIGLAFNLFGLTPAHFNVSAFQAPPTWNYTTFLDIVFTILIAVMLWRFLTTGGPKMIRAMAQPGGGGHAHADHEHMDHESMDHAEHHHD